MCFCLLCSRIANVLAKGESCVLDSARAHNPWPVASCSLTPPHSTMTTNEAADEQSAAKVDAQQISRPHRSGKSTKGYRSIEYLLRSESCMTNRHLRRLTGGGTHGGYRSLYDGTFTRYDPSVDPSLVNSTVKDEDVITEPKIEMEPWAEQFMSLLLYDERMTNLACKTQKSKKDLVDSVSIMERVEEVFAKYHDEHTLETGENILFFDMCSGKGITALMLSMRFPLAKIVCVDIRPVGATEHHLHEGAFENISRITGSVYDEDIVKDVINQTPANGTCIVLGTHLCGNLSVVAIDTIAQYPEQVSTAIVAPCCLPRQKKPKKLLHIPGAGWGYDTTQLARQQGIDPYDLWLERLFERAPAAEDQKNIVRDDDMISTKNNFIVVHSGER